ncbi:MAG TPA: hypothetical protein VF527_08725 [Pyrinomonadaceae bacterium]
MTPKDFILPVLTAVVGFFVAYMTTLLKFRKDLEAKYDESLRDQRIEVYKELWKLLQPLARYAPPELVTRRRVEQLAIELRRWYFEVGGLFCTDQTRDAYFALQKGIEKAVEETKNEKAETELEPDCAKELRGIGSNLRTSMARDVGTRVKSPLTGDNAPAALRDVKTA